MSVRLSAHGTPLFHWERNILGRVTSVPVDESQRRNFVFLLKESAPVPEIRGYAGVLTSRALATEEGPGIPTVHLPSLDYLDDGDAVSLSSNGYVRTLYRIRSPHNSLFTTDRCNSFCLMCSQPPKPVEDQDRIHELLRLVELIDPSTRQLGITGGEPTLLKDDILKLIRRCRELLPETSLHVLSNGRLFYYGSLARNLAAIGHPDLMIGVPLYSDIDSEHDYVVQSAGAFDQTLVGLQNLGRYGVPVEIRIVIHRLTSPRLPLLAEFIYRNLSFASHVTFMGLELMGFAVPNREELWTDPVEYGPDLVRAVHFLARRGMAVSVYNHQLCVVSREIWSYCRKSISDWKNDYLPECEGCVEKSNCGGFFTSALRRGYSAHIRPIQDDRGAGL